MILRDATACDAADICAIWNPVIKNSAATFTTELKTPDGICNDIKTRSETGHGFFVACKDGQILGFATYFQFRGGPGYVHSFEHTIVLSDAAKGQGIGRALMDHLEHHAAGNGCHTLVAGVSSENTLGVAFHAACGFQETARLWQVGRKFGRWMDLIVMQKFLSE